MDWSTTILRAVDVKTILTPEMFAADALKHLTVGVSFLKDRTTPHWAKRQPDTRTKWQKFRSRVKDKVWEWRHSLACRITPYGFDE
jgi:hypothetical protein